MAMTRTRLAGGKRGIALLVTVIFMSVMLAFGLALASLAYKQSVLASTAAQSQEAFYAADGALECTLYVDQQEGDFNYLNYNSNKLPDGATLAAEVAKICNGIVAATPVPTAGWDPTRLSFSARISLNGGAACADVVVYKYKAPIPQGSSGKQWTSFLFATGYNLPCTDLTSDARVVARGINNLY